MKLLLLFFSSATIFCLFVNYSSGPPAGRTGSPGDAKTCMASGCHADAPVTNVANSWITTNIPSKGFVKDSTYTIFITPKSGAAHPVMGFEAAVQTTAGAAVGTLGLLNTDSTQFADAAKTYVEHNKAGSQSAASPRTWKFSWKAPANVDSTTIYAAVNLTNGNGAPTGDSIFLNKLTIVRAFNTPTTEIKVAISLLVSPNPVSASAKNAYFSFNKPEAGIWNLRLYTLYGTVVSTQKIEGTGDIEQKLNISNFANGLHAFTISDDSDAIRASGKLVISE